MKYIHPMLAATCLLFAAPQVAEAQGKRPSISSKSSTKSQKPPRKSTSNQSSQSSSPTPAATQNNRALVSRRNSQGQSITRPRSNAVSGERPVMFARSRSTSVSRQGAAGAKRFSKVRDRRRDAVDLTDVDLGLPSENRSPRRTRDTRRDAVDLTDVDLGLPSEGTGRDTRRDAVDLTDVDLGLLSESGSGDTRPRDTRRDAVDLTNVDLGLPTETPARRGSTDSTRPSAGDISRERGGDLGAAPSPTPPAGATLGSDLPQNQPRRGAVSDSRASRPPNDN